MEGRIETVGPSSGFPMILVILNSPEYLGPSWFERYKMVYGTKMTGITDSYDAAHELRCVYEK